MAIRKRKNKWYVELRPSGHPAIYKTFDTKIEAQRWELEQKNLLKIGKSDLTRRTLVEVIERYRREISPSHKSYRNEVTRLNYFAKEDMAQKYISDITSDDIEDWIKNRKSEGLSDASILRDLFLLSSIFREAIRWKYCTNNPIRQTKKPKTPPHRERRISNEEISVILTILGYSDDKPVRTVKQAIAFAFLLALETGMRQGEIFKLLWEDVYLDKCYVFLRDTKNGENRVVPLSERAVDLLKKLKKDLFFKTKRVLPFSQSACGQVFGKALREAGIVDLHFHDSRHEACSRMAQIEGMTALTLGKIIGHRDPKSLMIYFNPTPEDLVKAIRNNQNPQ